MIRKNTSKKFYKHILIFIAMLVMGNYFIEFVISKQKDRYLAMQTELLLSKYNTNYKYFKIMSKDIYSIYKENQQVIGLLTQAKYADEAQRTELRDKLYKKLIKRYKRLRNMGVLQLHFHLQDNTSFLRLHKPKKFGDDLSSSRKSVFLTNKTKRPQEGFEMGKVTHGFRFVYPMFNKQEHIGSVEVSFSSKQLISSILDRGMIHSHFLVSKAEVDKKIFKENNGGLYQASLESPDFLLESKTHSMTGNTNMHESIFNREFTNEVSKMMKKRKAFSLSSSFNEETSVGSFIPIKDIQKSQTIAYLAIYTESDYLDNLRLEKEYIKMLFITILFLLFIFSIYATINNSKLQKMAHFDELTALPNRAYFYIQLESELNRAKRLKNKFGVMFIDLDGFKSVNDSYGHDVGDQLLIEVAQRLRICVRNIDVVARLGGDEFTVIITDIKHARDTLIVANKIIAEMEKAFMINKHVIDISASIGLSVYPTLAKDSDTLIKQSDSAMYIAKERGKNCAILYKKI